MASEGLQLAKLTVWLAANKLTLNIKKSNFMIFHRDRPSARPKVRGTAEGYGGAYIQSCQSPRTHSPSVNY